MRTRSHVTRLRAGAAAAAVVLGLAACGQGVAGGGAGADDPDDPAEVTGEFDWRRYEGESLRLVAFQMPWQAAIESRLDEFTELTGIEVEAESLPEEQFRQRLQVELTAGSSDVDVFLTQVQQDGLRFSASGWYEPLDAYLDNPALTSPDYDVDDFGDGVFSSVQLDGTTVAVPSMVETQVLFYRTDVLEEAGLEPPETMDELVEVAAAVDDPDGVRGFSSRGRRATAVTQIAAFLYNQGADWTDEDGNAAFDGPEGIAAFELYGELVRDYGPPGAVNNSWEELLSVFQQGQLAMWVDNSGQVASVLDESQSTVADVTGFSKMPSGPGGAFQTQNTWSAAMSATSERKGAAWYLLQWASSPEVVEDLQVTDGVVGGRESAAFSDDTPADFVEAFQSSLADARPQVPTVTEVPAVRDAIGVAIVAAIEGGDVAGAVSAAAEEFDRIVASSPADEEPDEAPEDP